MNVQRTLMKLVTIIVLCASLAMPYTASAAYETSATISGNTIKNTWVAYNTARLTDAYPYKVALKKTDGPSMFARIRGCNGYEWADYGPIIEFPNADPTAKLDLRLSTSQYTLRFCMNSYATGNNTHDSFTGTLYWWVQ